MVAANQKATMKKRATILPILAGAVMLPLLPQEAAAQYFSDDFNTDTAANWNVNASAAGSLATFNFDYSTLGIPAAPGSGGSTLGLRLQANVSGGVMSGVSVSPTGLSLPNEYILRYSLWQSFNGPAPGGGNGSTQVSGAGVGTSGTIPQRDGGTYDSLFFGSTAEGGAAQDYRVYPAAGLAEVATGYYAAGTHSTARNAADPYYSTFGGVTAPAEQVELFPQQTGATAAGAPGWTWREHVITKTADQITWAIDGVEIASVPASGITLGGNNFLLNHFDINSATSSDPNAGSLIFGLFDNVTVSAVPEPSTMTLFAFGALALVMRRKSR